MWTRYIVGWVGLDYMMRLVVAWFYAEFLVRVFTNSGGVKANLNSGDVPLFVGELFTPIAGRK